MRLLDLLMEALEAESVRKAVLQANGNGAAHVEMARLAELTAERFSNELERYVSERIRERLSAAPES